MGLIQKEEEGEGMLNFLSFGIIIQRHLCHSLLGNSSLCFIICLQKLKSLSKITISEVILN